jgi:GT2 family glycosyltransferase
MPLSRLIALFHRYADTHRQVRLPGMLLLDEAGQALGQVDRVTLHGTRLLVEGWTRAPRVALALGSARAEGAPYLPRPDVIAAHPALAGSAPGFALELGDAPGAARLSLALPEGRMIWPLPTPTPAARRRATAALALPFLRDLSRALPAMLCWRIDGQPRHKAAVKRHLGLAAAAAPVALQPLLYLEDSLAALPPDRRAAEQARLAPPGLGRHPITIVLPVFNAFDLLTEALDRVCRHTDLPWHLILIEDASTDPRVRPFLRGWAATQPKGRVTLIENAVNLGFIRSVNAGFAQALKRKGDVVLLNSDALVPPGWASRLLRPMLTHERVASVTPLSNDAEILNVPVICERSDFRPGEAEALDRVAARFHPDAALAAVPTGVGFCMAIARDWLVREPAFDTAFGRGYGEEVDWCRRVAARGGRHLAAAGLVVEHRGGQSFGSAAKARLVAQNGAIVSRRHPDFDASVQRFKAADPLAGPRLALGIALAGQRLGQTARLPLTLAHSLGGGAEDWLQRQIAEDVRAVGAALVLRVGGALRYGVELHQAGGVTRGATEDLALIRRMLDPVPRLGLRYSCGVGDPDPSTLPGQLLSLHRPGRDGLEVLFHDYFAISPSYCLLDGDGRYRGLPDPAAADAAHRHRRSNGTGVSLAEWQRAWGGLIRAAEQVTVFSQNSLRLVCGAYPEAAAKLRLLPHAPLAALPRLAKPDRAAAPVIGVLGNIGPQKGSEVLVALSRALARRGGGRIVLLGTLEPGKQLAPPSLVHGPYARDQIAALAARHGIDRWLIPSVWPETFSFTTQEALATGLPVWCFDLGAQAEAVRAALARGARGGGLLTLPTDGNAVEVEALLDLLLGHERPADQAVPA